MDEPDNTILPHGFYKHEQISWVVRCNSAYRHEINTDIVYRSKYPEYIERFNREYARQYKKAYTNYISVPNKSIIADI